MDSDCLIKITKAGIKELIVNNYTIIIPEIVEREVGKLYENGNLSLREASELLTLSLSEAIDLFREMGVKGNVGADDVLASLNSFHF